MYHIRSSTADRGSSSPKVARKRTCVISDSSARLVRSRARTRCVHGIASRKAESDSSARSVRSRCILCYCTGRTTRSTLNITMNITDTIIIYLIWRSSHLTAGPAWEPAVGTKYLNLVQSLETASSYMYHWYVQYTKFSRY